MRWKDLIPGDVVAPHDGEVWMVVSVDGPDMVGAFLETGRVVAGKGMRDDVELKNAQIFPMPREIACR